MYEPSHHLITRLLLNQKQDRQDFQRVQVCVVGTGEYVTGFVNEQESTSDKPIGVVALSLIDLRNRGFISRLILCGTNGKKFPGIRTHLKRGYRRLYGNNSGSLTSEDDQELQFDSFPEDNVSSDPEAYKNAIKSMNPGDVVMIFTPDHTHFEIAQFAMQSGMHTLVAKPLVQTLDHHSKLAALQSEDSDRGVMCSVEVHKRWDPIYQDARERIVQGALGNFSFYHSYMSQPVTQLNTFANWASFSDISYYLNAHHIDFHCWALSGLHNDTWRPHSVSACGSYGVANSEPYNMDTEDSITLTVQWKQQGTGNAGTAIYTSSWVSTKQSDVHSQQRFFYQGTTGEVNIDQAHRGYTLASDLTGFKSVNPLFMKYTPDLNGNFAGQIGYGYRSLAAFVESIFAVRNGMADLKDIIRQMPTVTSTSTILTTAILEAGRRSLDNRKRGANSDVKIVYNESRVPIGFE